MQNPRLARPESLFKPIQLIQLTFIPNPDVSARILRGRPTAASEPAAGAFGANLDLQIVGYHSVEPVFLISKVAPKSERATKSR